jgi:hypothetical protein
MGDKGPSKDTVRWRHKKAARALLRAALIRDCRFPGSAAVHTIDEQLIGCIGGERKRAG